MHKKDSVMKYEIELTDTFGGEANYSWVKRAELDVEGDVSDLALVRRAKAAVGCNGLKARKEDWGDEICLRFVGVCQILFIRAII